MTDATIKTLKSQMVAAVLCDEVKNRLDGLRGIMSGCRQGQLVALAAFLGEEIATSRQIPSKYRQEYLEKIVELIYRACNEARER